MMNRLATLLALLSFLAVPSFRLHAAEPVTDVNPVADRYFETKVRPLLVAKCFQCHDEKKQKGELRLDSRGAMLLGGDTGPSMVPGQPEKSLLVKAIGYEDEDLQMPPKGKLADDEIEILTHWIKLGAIWPGDDTKAATVRPKTAKITDEDRTYWFFQPRAMPAVPTVKNQKRVANPIDAFLLARLEGAGLGYAPIADKLTLIRRATFDLHGLPPAPVEIDAFLADTSDEAYSKLIDRLLASPRYGERMARHWLDLVRYADSDGFKADDYRPHIWRYRDWVIDAFNADMPYNDFVTAQLAGDEAKPGDPASLIATGYLRLWPYEYNQRDVHKQWGEITDDITGNVGEVFLGLSMHCARCHDHKFDPILQEDYFKLKSFFAAVLPDDSLTAATPKERSDYESKLALWHEKTKDIREKIAAIEEPARIASERGSLLRFTDDLQKILTTPTAELSPFDQQIQDLANRQLIFEHKGIPGRIKGDQKTELDRLHGELRKFDDIKPQALTAVTAIRDVGPLAPPTIIPGDRHNRGIEPGYLAVLSGSPLGADRPQSSKANPGIGQQFVSTQSVTQITTTTTQRRLTLAKWITRPDNALSTRVIVNRLWQFHFNQGIVPTSNDFGRQGDRPSHPKLLDWLANEFVAQGWSMKQMHKTIMLSHAYRQASHLRESPVDPNTAAIDPMSVDPANALLWKQRSHRLDAEQIRDAMLQASAEMTDVMHGPGIGESTPRRSVYLKYMRNNRPELIEIFDGPDGFNSTSRRNTTTIAPQALMLINGDWTRARARKLAESARRQAGGDQRLMIESAYRQTLGRKPTSTEMSDITAFLDTQSKPKESKPKSTPIADSKTRENESNIQGIAIDYRKGQQMRLADNEALKFDEFTLEAVFLLRSIDGNANVRTIASQWDSNAEKPGWAIGVTGQKSRHQPQTIILQLVGKNEEGQTAYDVVVSGLKPKLDTLYHLSVSVKLSEVDSTGITFHLRPMSENGQTETAGVGHTVIKEIDNNVAFVVGGRDVKSTAHGWDGILSNVRLYKEGLSPQQLIGGRSPRPEALIGDWRFAPDAFEKDSSGKGHNLMSVNGVLAANAAAPAGASPDSADFDAFIDLCHVLLNSNEFLYVD